MEKTGIRGVRRGKERRSIVKVGMCERRERERRARFSIPFHNGALSPLPLALFASGIGGTVGSNVERRARHPTAGLIGERGRSRPTSRAHLLQAPDFVRLLTAEKRDESLSFANKSSETSSPPPSPPRGSRSRTMSTNEANAPPPTRELTKLIKNSNREEKEVGGNDWK